jgi:glycosyltransferase involved in cell wall biosynthesis
MVQRTGTKVIVGIPAYNEEREIGGVVAGAAPHAAEVVVLDDGSTDRTARRALAAGALVIRHPRNLGKGAAVAALFEHARRRGADVLVLIDGDGQHDPAEIPRLVAPCRGGRADVVVGSRYLSIRSAVPLPRSLGQRFFNLLTAAASGVPCSDSQSGFRAFGRRAICAMRLSEAAFSVECEQQFECRAHGLRLAEVPVSCSYAAPPKRSAYRHGWQVLGRLGVMTTRRRVLGRDPVAARSGAGALVALPQPGPAAQPAFVGRPAFEEPEPLALLAGD